MNWQEHIHSDPTVLLGKPIIKGTRLSVEMILELFEKGWTKEMILASYPKLSDMSIKAVFGYVKDRLQGKSYAHIEPNTLSEAHESAVIYGSKKEQKKPFNPDDFLGIMSYPIEFLDSEIKKMRNEWDRDI
jgi:uncharacterized protein (DUF433 family)